MNEQSDLKYCVYLRKSSEGQERQALSIPAQRKEIEARFKGYNLEFLEEEKSAFIAYNRPVFANLVKRISAGEKIGLITWSPDRLARNEKDAAEITYLLRMNILKELIFCTHTFENTPEGIMMLQYALSQSQYESSKKGRDVRRGLETKAGMGHPPYPAIVGYKNKLGLEKGFKEWEPDEERFKTVRKMWDLMLTGNYKPPEILRIANEEWGFTTRKSKKLGGRPLSRSAIYKMFSNLSYTGRFEYPLDSGIIYQGEYEAMVTDEEYERVQFLLGKRGKPRKQLHDTAYASELIVCGECGSSVTADVKKQVICSGCKYKFSAIHRTNCPKCELDIADMKKPKVLEYVYYRCSKKIKREQKCSQRYVAKEELESQMDQHLSKIEINDRLLGWTLKHLKKAHMLESQQREAITDAQQKKFNNLSAKLDQLLDLRMDGEIDKDEYLKRKTALLKEKDRMQQLINQAAQRQKDWLELTEKTFNFAHYARHWFAEGDNKRKRQIIQGLGSNFVLKDKKLSIDIAIPFSIIEKGLSGINAESERLEPTKRGSNKGKRESCDSPNPAWLEWRDAFRTFDWAGEYSNAQYHLEQINNLIALAD